MSAMDLARAMIERPYFRFVDSEGAIDVVEELTELEEAGWQFIPPRESTTTDE